MTSIPRFCSEGANSSNKSIIGKPPTGDEACTEWAEGEDNLSNTPIEVLFSLLDDKPSSVDKLL